MNAIILETRRLLLRELNWNDFHDLCKILMDRDVMYAYEHAFSQEEAMGWLENQLRRYREDGFGLWAVIHKKTGELIGQCGLTLQDFCGKQVVEIGYLFRKEFWHQGYASEAASGCKTYAFHTLHIPEVYSIIRDTNIASQNVAIRNGMEICGGFVKHYYGIDMPHIVYGIRNPASGD